VKFVRSGTGALPTFDNAFQNITNSAIWNSLASASDATIKLVKQITWCLDDSVTLDPLTTNGCSYRAHYIGILEPQITISEIAMPITVAHEFGHFHAELNHPVEDERIMTSAKPFEVMLRRRTVTAVECSKYYSP
jgi:hypothetical protein